MKQVKKTKTLKVLTIALGAALMLASCITFVNCEFVNDTISWVKSTGEDLIGLTDAREKVADADLSKAKAIAENLNDAANGLDFAAYETKSTTFEGLKDSNGNDVAALVVAASSGGGIRLQRAFSAIKVQLAKARTIDEYNAVIAYFDALISAYNEAVAESDDIAAQAGLRASAAQAESLRDVLVSLTLLVDDTESTPGANFPENLTGWDDKTVAEQQAAYETYIKAANKRLSEYALTAGDTTRKLIAEAKGVHGAVAAIPYTGTPYEAAGAGSGQPWSVRAKPEDSTSQTPSGGAYPADPDTATEEVLQAYITNANAWIAEYTNAVLLKNSIETEMLNRENDAQLAALKAQAQALKNTLIALNIKATSAESTPGDSIPDDTVTVAATWQTFITNASAAIAQYNSDTTSQLGTAKGQARMLFTLITGLGTIDSDLISNYGVSEPSAVTPPLTTDPVTATATIDTFLTYITAAQTWYAQYQAAVLQQAVDNGNTAAALAALTSEATALKNFVDAITDDGDYALSGVTKPSGAVPTDKASLETYISGANAWLAAYNTAKTAALITSQAEATAQVNAAESQAQALQGQVTTATQDGNINSYTGVTASGAPAYPTANLAQLSTWTTYIESANNWLAAYNTAKNAYEVSTGAAAAETAAQLTAAREQAAALNSLIAAITVDPALNTNPYDVGAPPSIASPESATQSACDTFIASANAWLANYNQDNAALTAAKLAAARGTAEGLYTVLSGGAINFSVYTALSALAPTWPIVLHPGDNGYDTAAADVTLAAWQTYITGANAYLAAYTAAVASVNTATTVEQADKRYMIFLYGSSTTTAAGVTTTISPAWSEVITNWTASNNKTFTYTEVTVMANASDTSSNYVTTTANSAASKTVDWNDDFASMAVGDTVFLNSSSTVVTNPTTAEVAVTRVH